MNEETKLLHKIFFLGCALTWTCISVLIFTFNWKVGIAYLGLSAFLVAYGANKMIHINENKTP